MIATGGTGGHLFPAIALGEGFRARGHEVLMVGSGRPLDQEVAARSPLPWQQLPVARLQGVGWQRTLLNLFSLPVALLRSLLLLIKIKPDLVVGLGGANGGPLVLLGRLLGLKAAIVEPNRVPGLANRLLAPLAHRIFLSFPLQGDRWRSKSKALITGNPIRREVLNEFTTTQKTADRFTLLILGGSQGARFFNQLIVALLSRFAAHPQAYRLIHLTGDADYEFMRASYQKYPTVQATLLPFVENPGRYYKEADLVLARAGAGTIGDLIALGCPALLVPYPYAADQHQEANAHYLVERGAALVKKQEELTADVFWQLLEGWRVNRAPLLEIAKQAQALQGEVDPTERMIIACEALVRTNA